MNKGRKLTGEYEINSSTLVIRPVKYGSRIFSKIYELEQNCISPFKPMDIIKESCFSFGSNYEGRKAATKKLIGVTHKVPIAISPYIFLFPTSSPEKPDCIWVAHDHIVEYDQGEQSCVTIIKFRNNQNISLPISPRSLQNQLIRTMMLKSKLSNNKKDATIKNGLGGHAKSAERAEKYTW